MPRFLIKFARFTSIPFYHDGFVLIVNRNHLLANKITKSTFLWKELTASRSSGVSLIRAVGGHGSVFIKAAQAVLKSRNCKFSHTLGVVNAVVNGTEAGIVSRFAAQTSPAAITLTFKPLMYRVFHLVYGLCGTKAVEVLISFLSQIAIELFLDG